jgi:hypothetical protein
MKIPVAPVLYALLAMCCATFLVGITAYAWPPFWVSCAYFLYCVHREIYHNGRPLVLWHRK